MGKGSAPQYRPDSDRTGETERAPANLDIDVTGDKYNASRQEIATSAEAIALGDVGTPGYILCHNCDATNYIEIGYDDAGFKPVVKMLAGEWALFRLAPAVPQAQANTAACDLEYFLVEA